MISGIFGLDTYREKIWNRGYNIGYESGLMDCDVKHEREKEDHFNKGYKLGFKEGQTVKEEIDNMFVKIERQHLDNLLKKIVMLEIKLKNPKKWSRKGLCPSCGVSTGVNHKNSCEFDYSF